MQIKRIVLIISAMLITNSAALMAQNSTSNSSQNSASANSENWQEFKQRFKSEKVAFITTQMDLTVEEAQKFWPIYNKYDELFDEIGELRHKNMKLNAECIEPLTEEECRSIIETNFNNDEKELATRRKYHEELSKIFSQKQILSYYRAEHEFRRTKMNKSKQTGASFGKSYKYN